jgi:hypothetical protein
MEARIALRRTPLKCCCCFLQFLVHRDHWNVSRFCSPAVFSGYFDGRLSLVRRFDRRGLFGVLLALPLTAGLVWYSFDYLTPTDLNLGINTSPDWTPHQHGLTLQRDLATLAFQTPIALFNLWYWDTTMRVRSKKSYHYGGIAPCRCCRRDRGLRRRSNASTFNPSAVYVTIAAPGPTSPTCALHKGEAARPGYFARAAHVIGTAVHDATGSRAELRASELRAFSLT